MITDACKKITSQIPDGRFKVGLFYTFVRMGVIENTVYLHTPIPTFPLAGGRCSTPSNFIGPDQ